LRGGSSATCASPSATSSLRQYCSSPSRRPHRAAGARSSSWLAGAGAQDATPRGASEPQKGSPSRPSTETDRLARGAGLPQQRARCPFEDLAPRAHVLALGVEVLDHLAHSRSRDLDPAAARDFAIAGVLA